MILRALAALVPTGLQDYILWTALADTPSEHAKVIMFCAGAFAGMVTKRTLQRA
jgi:hypothetical protein